MIVMTADMVFDQERPYAQRLLRAQALSRYQIGHLPWRRVVFGKEVEQRQECSQCSDCAAELGQYHLPWCDMEECPSCGEQALSCECDLIVCPPTLATVPAPS